MHGKSFAKYNTNSSGQSAGHYIVTYYALFYNYHEPDW